MVMEKPSKPLKEKVIPLTPSPIYTYLFKMVNGIIYRELQYIEKGGGAGCLQIELTIASQKTLPFTMISRNFFRI